MSIKDKYPDGFKGKVYVHFDGDDAQAGCGEASETAGEPEPARDGNKGWSFSVGYNRDRGGFFCENGRSRRLTGTAFPSPEIKGIDVQVINGDVTINLDDDPEADVVITGEAEELEARLSDSGVLSIRQGKTASLDVPAGAGAPDAADLVSDLDLAAGGGGLDGVEAAGEVDVSAGALGVDELPVQAVRVQVAAGRLEEQLPESQFADLCVAAGGLDGEAVHLHPPLQHRQRGAGHRLPPGRPPW